MAWTRSALLPLAAVVSLSLLGCDASAGLVNENPVQANKPTHTPRPMPKPTHEGISEDGSLLEGYVDRSPSKPEELERWILPFQSRAAIAEMLILAGDDDPVRLRPLMTDNARWGMPDRRQTGAQAIYTDADPLGVEFLTALRSATSRFKKRARFTLEPFPGFEMFAVTGAEPVWAAYTSDDGLDFIGLRLITERGVVKIDYVGFFTTRATGPVHMPDAGDAPPVIPYIKMPVDLSPAI